MAKKVILGIWKELEETFTAPYIEHLLGCKNGDMESWAMGASTPSESQGELLEDFCLLHGIKPQVWVMGVWKRHHGVCIVDTPRGWKAHSLGSKGEWAKGSRWGGDVNDLCLAGPEIVAAAKLKGFK